MSTVATPVSISEIFSSTPETFDAVADSVLRYQRTANPVYGRFAETGMYLPVEAFKLAHVACFPRDEEEGAFLSSGTGPAVRARHSVRDFAVYDESVRRGFARVFGRGPFRFLTYLPQYAPESSLVRMAAVLTDAFGAPGSASVLADAERLEREAGREGPPIVLLGAAFGLLDLLDSRSFMLPEDTTVIETGGMKTYRREVSRPELHGRLAAGFGLAASAIRSEYGMCELFSQAYTNPAGRFEMPPWVRVSVRDPEDPSRARARGESGQLAFVDLANLHTVSAILTQDVGVLHDDGFDVLGRLSGAELRGCNFLLESDDYS